MNNQITPTAKRVIELNSPIGKMPFGKFKDELIYHIPMNSLDWMKQNMLLSDATLKTFNDAQRMGIHTGEIAVLRRYIDPHNARGEKWLITLQAICSTSEEAHAKLQTTDLYQDFIYPII